MIESNSLTNSYLYACHSCPLKHLQPKQTAAMSSTRNLFPLKKIKYLWIKSANALVVGNICIYFIQKTFILVCKVTQWLIPDVKLMMHKHVSRNSTKVASELLTTKLMLNYAEVVRHKLLIHSAAVVLGKLMHAFILYLNWNVQGFTEI